jgi:hypothetical protein
MAYRTWLITGESAGRGKAMAGISSLPAKGYHSASNFALEGLTEALSQEIESLGLRAFLVEPGSLRTGIQHRRRPPARRSRTTQRRPARSEPRWHRSLPSSSRATRSRWPRRSPRPCNRESDATGSSSAATHTGASAPSSTCCAPSTTPGARSRRVSTPGPDRRAGAVPVDRDGAPRARACARGVPACPSALFGMSLDRPQLTRHMGLQLTDKRALMTGSTSVGSPGRQGATSGVTDTFNDVATPACTPPDDPCIYHVTSACCAALVLDRPWASRGC